MVSTGTKATGFNYCAGIFFNLQPKHLEKVEAVYDRAALIALPPALQTVMPSTYCTC